MRLEGYWAWYIPATNVTEWPYDGVTPFSPKKDKTMSAQKEYSRRERLMQKAFSVGDWPAAKKWAMLCGQMALWIQMREMYG